MTHLLLLPLAQHNLISRGPLTLSSRLQSGSGLEEGSSHPGETQTLFPSLSYSQAHSGSGESKASRDAGSQEISLYNRTAFDSVLSQR